MKLTQKVFVNLVVQGLALLLLLFYFLVTNNQFEANKVYFIIAVLLVLYGALRKPAEVMWVASGIVFIYGCYLVYRLFISLELDVVNWNDMAWLLIFPFFALIGGLNRGLKDDPLKRQQALKEAAAALKVQEVEELERLRPFMIDDKLGYTNEEGFLTQLDEELFRVLRDRRSLSVLVLEIDNYVAFKHESGYKHTQLFLDKVAELISEVMYEARIRAYLNDGLYAIIMTGPDQADVETARIRLDSRFHALLLTRSRREGMVKLKLNYGSAECPLQGSEAKAVLELAKQEIKRKEVN